jgi:hypothetical protein
MDDEIAATETLCVTDAEALPDAPGRAIGVVVTPSI